MATIRVQMERQEAAYHFQARNEAGFTVDMDDATAYEEGAGNGVGPMQLLIMAVGGCSGVDIVSILSKSRQQLTSFGIDVTGVRPDGVAPALYSSIHVHYRLEGSLEEGKVRRAIHLSLEKYCSVAKTLEPTAEITYSFDVNGTRFDT
jgi:putative redox protein